MNPSNRKSSLNRETTSCIQNKNRKRSFLKTSENDIYFFTDDIVSQYPGKQVDTKCMKSIPSLFESDSDPEIDYFQIKDGIKNEVKELSTCISYPDDICPVFDKNVEMRTYFNKKLYPINNKSDIKSLNIVEEINQEPTNLCNHVRTVNDSNLCKSISQNYSKTKKSLKVMGLTTSECIQTNTEDDDVIIVTESFIRQLKNEFDMIKSESQKNVLVKNCANINNSVIIESGSDSSTTISEEVIGKILLFTNICIYILLFLDQSIENHPKSEKNITCHLSPVLIEPYQYFHSAIKDKINIKVDSFNNEGNSNNLLKIDNLSSANNSHSTNYKNCYSKCYCKNFISFNNNYSKIFNSKIKHFAFNNNANKVRQQKLHKKHLEANILNTLITKDHINIIQSREHNIPIFNSISIDKKYEKCIDLKENDHFEPKDNEQNIEGNINKNSICILKSDDSSKNERKLNCLSSAASIKMSNPILLKTKCVLSNNNCEIAHLLEDKENYLDDCVSFKICNELYKIKSSHKSIVNKNESLPKYIQDILKEMYVDELFVSICQHMVDLYDDDDQSKSDVFFQSNKCRKTPYEKLMCDINTNVSTNVETLWRSEINYGHQENNKLGNPSTKENNSVSLRKPNDIKTKYPDSRVKTANTTQKSNSLQKPKSFAIL
ncbi:hypothetical protein ACI65C_005562 [Semiaphis heraclei]